MKLEGYLKDISGYPSDNGIGYEKRYCGILKGYLIEISKDILGYLERYRRISIDIFERYHMDIMWITQGYKHWI